jgi:hypothetical protein
MTPKNMSKVRHITVAVTPELYRQTRLLAAEYDSTVTAIVAYLLERLPNALKSSRYPVGGPKPPAMSPDSPAAPPASPATWPASPAMWPASPVRPEASGRAAPTPGTPNANPELSSSSGNPAPTPTKSMDSEEKPMPGTAPVRQYADANMQNPND